MIMFAYMHKCTKKVYTVYMVIVTVMLVLVV